MNVNTEMVDNWWQTKNKCLFANLCDETPCAVKRFLEVDSLIIYVEMTNDDSVDLHWDIEFHWTTWIFHLLRKRSLVPGRESACSNPPTRFRTVCFDFWEIILELITLKWICTFGRTCFIDILFLQRVRFLPCKKIIFFKKKIRQALSGMIRVEFSSNKSWISEKGNATSYDDKQHLSTAVLSVFALIFHEMWLVKSKIIKMELLK